MQALLCDVDGVLVDVEGDGCAVGLEGGERCGARAAAWVEDCAVGRAGCVDEEFEECERLLGGVADAFGGHVVERGDLDDGVCLFELTLHAV